MLQFLRKIKNQQIAQGKTGSYWAFTLGQFVLVVISILVALQIENWNQNRQDKKLENTLLSEILLNLRTDLNDVEYNLRFHDRIRRSNEIILNHIIENKPYHDTLELHFGRLAGSTIFNKNLSAYESLKSIGIDIISNDRLRQQITYLYSVQYGFIQEFQQIDHNFHIEHLYDDISEHLDVIQYYQKAMPINYDKLKKDNELKQHLRLNIFYRDLILSQYQTAKVLMEELIEDIEEELNDN